MKVIALKDCYHDMTYRREGEEFNWKGGKDLPKYVRPVGDASAHEQIEQLDGNRDKRLLQALNSLDHSNDDQWTKEGLPSVEATEEAAGFKVTRAEIKDLAPDLERNN
jgi:ribonuclease D